MALHINRQGKKAFDGDFVNVHNFSVDLAAVQEGDLVIRVSS